MNGQAKVTDKQLTPMQEAIDKTETLMALCQTQGEKFLINAILCNLKQLLPKEKQVHEQFWDDGNDNVTYDDLHGYNSTETFEDYYNNKFKND